MDHLLCPICQEMPLMLKGSHRVCDNCGHEMNEMAYQMYAAESIEKFNKMYDAEERKVLRNDRKHFGSRKPSSTTKTL